MKKLFAVILTVILAAGVLSGCGKQNSASDTDQALVKALVAAVSSQKVADFISGKYGKEEAPHGWVEIPGEDGLLTYDVEMEMHYLAENKQMDLYAMDDVRRRGHGYRELSVSDDLAPRETCEGLLPG